MAQDNAKSGVSPEYPAASSQSEKSLIDIAIERGYCTAEQVSRLRRQSGANSANIAQSLMAAGVLTQQQVRACERAMRGTQVIAGFEILEKVGQGGMGAVFRARQISMDRIIALKILPPKLAQDPIFKTRFLNEAKVSAKLSHINIINGIDCGEAGGYTFFAMEFVDGQTIKQVLKEKGKFAPIDALKIIRQMVDALAYARSQGLVHRDVKPDNIMLTASGIAKLCDLGLAKHVEGNDDASLTQSGQAVGTPHYIAPEQARGEAVDFRSDIYSLGATFYHMLTGKTPFDAPTSAAVMALHIANDTKSPCDIDVLIPPGFGHVISKMMAKDQADRYGDPDDLLADLAALDAGRAPRAATFRAKSSCLMPQSVPANRSLRGRTTGPQAPVGDDRNYRTGANLRAARRKQSTPWVGIAALGVVVVIAVLFIMSRQSSNSSDLNLSGGARKTSEVAPGNVNSPPASGSNPGAKVENAPPVAVADPKTPAAPVAEVRPPKAVASEQPKKVEPPPAVRETQPAKPVESVQPVNTAAIEKRPEPPAVKKFSLTPEMIEARWYAEMIRKTSKADLGHALNTDLKAMAEAPTYKPIHKEVDAALDTVRTALKFEQDSMKAMAAAGYEVELTPERFNQVAGILGKSTRVKAQSFDDHGLSVMVSNGQFPIKANEIAGNQIVDQSPDKSPSAQLPYLFVRGDHERCKSLAAQLQGKDKIAWEHLLDLWTAGERDLRAGLELGKVEDLARTTKWKEFDAAVAVFEKDYAASAPLLENAEHLAELKAAADNALRPKNPYKLLYHAVRNELRDDGFLELEYDFSTPEQALDFAAAPEGQPRVMDGRLFVGGAADNFDRLCFVQPIADLREILISARFIPRPDSGFRLGIVREGSPVGGNLGVLLGIDVESVRLYRGGNLNDFSETPGGDLNLSDEITVGAQSRDGRDFNWTINTKPIGRASAPDSLRGGRLAMNCFKGLHSSWKRFKIVFRPEQAAADNSAQEFSNLYNYALAANGAAVRGGLNPGWLIDGDTGQRAGITELRPGSDVCFIVLPKPVTLNCVRLLLNDDDNRFFRYKLEVSPDDGNNWTGIADKSDDTHQCRGWQVDRFEPRTVKVIKLIPIFASTGQNFQCRELQAFNLTK